MQRKSTRKAKVETGIIPYEDQSNNVIEDNVIEHESRKHCKQELNYIDVKNPLIIALKYLLVLILILPWIVQITTKLKTTDFIPKMKDFIEETFTCPITTCPVSTCPSVVDFNKDCNCEIKSNKVPEL